MYVNRSDFHSCNNCSAVGPHASLISWDGYYYEVIKIIVSTNMIVSFSRQRRVWSWAWQKAWLASWRQKLIRPRWTASPSGNAEFTPVRIKILLIMFMRQIGLVDWQRWGSREGYGGAVLRKRARRRLKWTLILGCIGGGKVVGCTYRGGHDYPFARKRWLGHCSSWGLWSWLLR